MDKPDFRTICRFKIECAEQIEEVFKMTVIIAKKSGMVKLKHIAIDGTKIKANASPTNLINQEEIQTIRELLKKGIQPTKKKTKFTVIKEAMKYHPNFYLMVLRPLLFVLFGVLIGKGLRGLVLRC